jgi:hypothetical protein
MPELPYGAALESGEPIPRAFSRYNTYSWGRLVGVMPHRSITLAEKELTTDGSINSITVSSPADVERNKYDPGKDGNLSGILRIMTCGAGLFSDGYLNGVRSFLDERYPLCGG